MTTWKKLSLSIILLCILLFGGIVFLRFKDRLIHYIALPDARSYESAKTLPRDNSTVVTATDAALPDELNLKIPFTSQAPHKNWDLPYQHFCEEASVLMVASYLQGVSELNPDDADTKLLAIMDFEDKRFGFHLDTNAEQTAIILREFYYISNVAELHDPSEEAIKKALAAGKAVIVPAAGRKLGNPYYQQPGPPYHMLVIKGYTSDGKFITNDPGTRRGADFIYKTEVIMDAIHDWNGSEDTIEGGKKVMIVVG